MRLDADSERFAELRIKSQTQLIDFIETEIQLGFTFLAVAVSSRVRGNREHFLQAKRDAVVAAETALRFLERVASEETRTAAHQHYLELNQAIETLEL
jgi:hypothetical protein